LLYVSLCDVRYDLVTSISCEGWNMTVNKSMVEIPANTFIANHTYIITLTVSATGRNSSFYKQTVRPVIRVFIYLANSLSNCLFVTIPRCL